MGRVKNKGSWDEVPTFRNEKQFGGWLERTAKQYGYTYYHTWQSKHSTPGFPDYVLIKGTRILFFELKVGKNTPTVHQQKWLEMLQEVERVCWAHITVALVYPENIPWIINELKRGDPR